MLLKQEVCTSHTRAVLLRYEPGVFGAITAMLVCIVGTWLLVGQQI